LFSGIYGHDTIKNRLKNIIESKKVSHSYIFSGKSGVGKKSMAYAFASALTGGNEADIITVTNENFGVKDRAALSVEAVKAARSEMYVKPYISEKKVYIFPDAETMKAGAQNALLKVMEEPPSYIVIILITERRDALLETVRSRSNEFYFSPLSDEDIIKWAKDNSEDIEKNAIKFCGGSIKTAKMLKEREDILEITENVREIFRGLINGNKAYIYKAITLLTEADKETREIILNMMISALEDVMLGESDGIIKIDGLNRETASSVAYRIELARGALLINCTSSMVFSELMLDIWRIING